MGFDLVGLQFSIFFLLIKKNYKVSKELPENEYWKHSYS